MQSPATLGILRWLHVVEVAFRNVLFDVGVETTRARQFDTRDIPCWLDATPTMLEKREETDVREAVRRLGPNRKRYTPGHLVGQFGFGFWTRLYYRPYEHRRSTGPQLWPAAAKRFPNCPRMMRNRADIGRAFAELRDFRNLVAHHQPLWDRKPIEWHRRALELMYWMNAGVSAAAASGSRLQAVYDAGPAAFRPWIAEMMTL